MTKTQFLTETIGLPNSAETQVTELSDGATFDLRIAPVVKQIGDVTVRMLAYNGSIPGSVLKVRQGSELLVRAMNDGDTEATVHWHGLLVENRYDGTLQTQMPMPIGRSSTYRLRFLHPGIYWYHPHIREDYGQEMGLYGNILVVPAESDYWQPVNREIVLTLDDILIEDGKVASFKRNETTHVAMGRFGNVMLVNGETNLSLTAQAGEVVRFYLTNTANTRVFKVGFEGARMKLVGGDSGRSETEQFVDTVILAPSERSVVDVLFDKSGPVRFAHHSPGRRYKLATIEVANNLAEPSFRQQYEILRRNSDMTAERDRITAHLDRAPDKTLAFVAEMEMPAAETSVATVYACPMHPEIRGDEGSRCPKCKMKLMPLSSSSAHTEHHDMHHDASMDSHDGIEWEDAMAEINRLTTPANMRWKIVDRGTNAENHAIDWRFETGDRVKIRLINEPESDHPMHHPFHIHGAGRFLVLSRDGIPESNLTWKDTVLVRAGQTVDILLDIDNPGVWMAHCHISEHHESGMMFSFNVAPRASERKVLSVVVAGGRDEATVLTLAASLALVADKALGSAILEAIPDGKAFGQVGDFNYVEGQGMAGFVDGYYVVLGGSSWFSALGLSIGNLEKWAEAMGGPAQDLIFVVVDGQPAGLLRLS